MAERPDGEETLEKIMYEISEDALDLPETIGGLFDQRDTSGRLMELCREHVQRLDSQIDVLILEKSRRYAKNLKKVPSGRVGGAGLSLVQSDGP